MRLSFLLVLLFATGVAVGFALNALAWSLAPTLLAGFAALTVLTAVGIAAAWFFRRPRTHSLPAFGR